MLSSKSLAKIVYATGRSVCVGFSGGNEKKCHVEIVNDSGAVGGMCARCPACKRQVKVDPRVTASAASELSSGRLCGPCKNGVSKVKAQAACNASKGRKGWPAGCICVS